ncbi:MAG TPA: SpoIIE family protein phosphatase [Ktedonobacteraceae bacterium]|jgi:serine phosphatase RsbU (regulator of sigma subunit)|nr:SpoIIE family protein phosphatase [Ktedonobacteraceae bacterium]
MEKQKGEALFAQTILDSLDIIMAVLDTDGKIVAVNKAWRHVAQESCSPVQLKRTGVGVNYLQVCREARGVSADFAAEALIGIESILHGTQLSFTMEYPCFSPTRQNWYQMNVTPLAQHKGAVVAHIDITERKHLELRFQMQVDKAARIQLQLLPEKVPQVDALDVYSLCRQVEQVGGDFYDFFSCRGHTFAFAIGDVSGKGLSAALLMTMIHTTIHAVVRQTPLSDPEAVLVHMSENLYDDLSRAGMFATIFVGCYNADTGKFVYANAGHSPIIYCPSGGSAVLLEADIPGLGIFPLNACRNAYIPLNDHDVLVAGTDGLSESFNARGEMFGYERLLKTVEAHAHLSAEQIAAELLKAIAQFTHGYKQSDDQTLVILKRMVKR